MKIPEVKQEVKPEAIPEKPVESVADIAGAAPPRGPRVAIASARDSKPKKTLEKVSCPDCGKLMTSKTLKYNHV